jgi:hypothetical protein
MFAHCVSSIDDSILFFFSILHETGQMILQGSVKASLRKRFLSKCSDRGANRLSPKSEFLRPQ